ncbi:hypothetical protein [uncultured Polaribacter sp.]|uniref:hypothetical protein n=1 Tax=uncultured Polaribacter sp. TaxID=174711 RepID=UPI002631B40B|nr:hypothetical protein [uncultured Polaribacter sp.]
MKKKYFLITGILLLLIVGSVFLFFLSDLQNIERKKEIKKTETEKTLKNNSNNNSFSLISRKKIDTDLTILKTALIDKKIVLAFRKILSNTETFEGLLFENGTSFNLKKNQKIIELNDSSLKSYKSDSITNKVSFSRYKIEKNNLTIEHNSIYKNNYLLHSSVGSLYLLDNGNVLKEEIEDSNIYGYIFYDKNGNEINKYNPYNKEFHSSVLKCEDYCYLAVTPYEKNENPKLVKINHETGNLIKEINVNKNGYFINKIDVFKDVVVIRAFNHLLKNNKHSILIYDKMLNFKGEVKSLTSIEKSNINNFEKILYNLDYEGNLIIYNYEKEKIISRIDLLRIESVNREPSSKLKIIDLKIYQNKIFFLLENKSNKEHLIYMLENGVFLGKLNLGKDKEILSFFVIDNNLKIVFKDEIQVYNF